MVERLRPQRRRVDLRPYMNDLRLSSDSLEIDLRVSPTGSARADEVLALLGLSELLESSAVLERTVLDLEDEIHPDCCSAAVAGCLEPQLATIETPDAPPATDY